STCGAGQPRSRQRPAPAERPVPPRRGGRSRAGYGAGIARDISLAESDGHVGAELAPPVFLFSLCPPSPSPFPHASGGKGSRLLAGFLPSLLVGWGQERRPKVGRMGGRRAAAGFY